MKKLMLATAALGALTAAGPVLAADLPARMPYKAPPPPIPYFSWTGCYIGGHVGGAWEHRDLENGTIVATTALGATTTFLNTGGFDTSGWLAGGQAGCQWQITSVVFGIEGDGSWTNLSGTLTDPLTGTTFSTNNNNQVLYDVTARLGWAWDRWLIYAKGGGAWAQENFSVFNPIFGTVSDSFTRNGWVIGGGVEWAFWDNWSVKLEYLHYDFGSRGFNGFFPFVTPTTLAFDVNERVDTIKLGINWRFYPWGAPAAPVVARY
jgi:outer membrane immunogenic protein